MTKHWTKKSQEEIKDAVFAALDKNINYNEDQVLGVPASYLDPKVFNQDASFLKEAPFMYALVKNPNHIGCHTVGESEPFFRGSHMIEKELIRICAEDILKGNENAQDGYVASGGTEANLQAIWIYRNFFMREHGASPNEIVILCSEDSHYSMDKAANILSIDIAKIPVQEDDRSILHTDLASTIERELEKGKKHFIIICNMMTTMFGSVDDVDLFTSTLTDMDCSFKLHIDGAYGGFYSPFTDDNSQMTFQNEHITSFTLDAHKMAQSPYGTGIFIIKKGFIHHANTKEASYVEGEDFTIIGSRSGANAIAVWMILCKNGPYGWHEKVFILQKRTEWLCKQLNELDVKYYRNPKSNILTISAGCIDQEIAKKFGLVPDNHSTANWFKVVIMDHVTIEKLSLLVDAIKIKKHNV